MTILKAIRLFDKFVDANTNKDNRDLWIEDEKGAKLTWDHFISSLDELKDIVKHNYNIKFWSKYGNELINTAKSLPIMLDSLYYGHYRNISSAPLIIMKWNLETMWNTHQPIWRDWIEKICKEEKEKEITAQQEILRKKLFGDWSIMTLNRLCFIKSYSTKTWIKLLYGMNDIHYLSGSHFEKQWLSGIENQSPDE